MSTTVYTAPSERTRADRIYDDLQTALLNGYVHPDARLTEPKVSAYFGVSRTPVREALARLSRAGLLVRQEFGYAPVRPTLSGIRDLYELRLSIELAGVRRAKINEKVVHDESILQTERQHWLDLRDNPPPMHPEFVHEDERFHLAVLRAAGNAEFVEALKSINIRIRRVRMHDFMVNMRIETTIDEHLAILDALLDGDLDQAAERLTDHIGASLEVVIERVHRAIEAMDQTDYSLTKIGRALR